MLSHAGILLLGHNQGVTAVISFFLLSGFVMTALIRRNYNSMEQISTFYVDRALRLFPQFVLYVLATLVFVAATGFRNGFLENLSVFKVTMNALMLPLSLYMLGLENSLLLPQAWSLGLELTFYIAIPFILINRVRPAAFMLSLGVFGLAYFGLINADYFGYRLLPGTLFMFLMGSFLYERKDKRLRFILPVTYAVLLIAFLWLVKNPSFNRPYNFEVLFGILIGVPAVAILSRQSGGKIDETLGHISYGVFLNHFLLIWVFQELKIDTVSIGGIGVLIAISIALAWITYYFVERPVLVFRRRLRKSRTRVTGEKLVEQH